MITCFKRSVEFKKQLTCHQIIKFDISVFYTHSFLLNSFFFLSGFSFTNTRSLYDSRGTGMPFLTPFEHFHLVFRHLDISRTVTAERSLQIASVRT